MPLTKKRAATGHPPEPRLSRAMAREHRTQVRHRHRLLTAGRPTAAALLVPAALAATLAVVAVALLILLIRRRRRAAARAGLRQGSNLSEPGRHVAPSDAGSCDNVKRIRRRGGQVFTYKELEVATDGFRAQNVIGSGGFGVVYRGALPDGTLAAVKMLNRQGRQGEREFRVEVDLLSRLQSPFLVGLLGYCADPPHRLLVFEHMPNGSLQQHLHPPSRHSPSLSRTPSLSWSARLRIALDCARALEFLHERSVPSVIHRDFKCSNVLLDHNYRAKVSDFGMAKVGSDKVNGQVLTRVLGTTGYVAPEYALSGKLTTKSDVYSFGVVLLELLTGRLPVDVRRPPGEDVLVAWALPRLTNREKLMEMVDPVLEGHCPKKELIQVAAIAAVCVQSEADYRPLMTDIVQSLIPLVRTQSGS